MLAFVHGDKACFDELFNRYRQPIYTFYRRRVTDRARAEELMQEAFLAVLHAASRYEQRAHFRTYLCDSVPNSAGRPKKNGVAHVLLPPGVEKGAIARGRRGFVTGEQSCFCPSDEDAGDGTPELARSLENCRKRFKRKDRLSQRLEVVADVSVRICRLETAWRHLLDVTGR